MCADKYNIIIYNIKKHAPLAHFAASTPVRSLARDAKNEGSVSGKLKTERDYSTLSSMLTGATVAAGCFGGYLAYEFSVFPEPCEAALRAAQSHRVVVDALGKNTRRSWVWDGDTGDQMASISFSLIGDSIPGKSRTARIQSKLVKSTDANGVVIWKPLVLIATFSDSRIVDLLEKKKKKKKKGSEQKGEGGVVAAMPEKPRDLKNEEV